eukprot:TRINITY_DN4549_c1_g1_i3.p1 TRINITY_DN4549_c1_g1~~TRINITY_DN4549_c1_g1_i3.p1  ORF type:complete len:1541 (-),score=187.61 TRINITY_DN4549_c1_g1_i3:661-5283(-)
MEGGGGEASGENGDGTRRNSFLTRLYSEYRYTPASVSRNARNSFLNPDPTRSLGSEPSSPRADTPIPVGSPQQTSHSSSSHNIRLGNRRLGTSFQPPAPTEPSEPVAPSSPRSPGPTSQLRTYNAISSSGDVAVRGPRRPSSETTIVIGSAIKPASSPNLFTHTNNAPVSTTAPSSNNHPSNSPDSPTVLHGSQTLPHHKRPSPTGSPVPPPRTFRLPLPSSAPTPTTTTTHNKIPPLKILPQRSRTDSMEHTSTTNKANPQLSRKNKRLTIEMTRFPKLFDEAKLLVEIKTSPTTAERLEFSPLATVDNVKNDIFRQCEPFHRLRATDYYLALRRSAKKGEDPPVLFVEFAKFAWANDAIHTAILANQVVKLQIVDKELYANSQISKSLIPEGGTVILGRIVPTSTPTTPSEPIVSKPQPQLQFAPAEELEDESESESEVDSSDQNIRNGSKSPRSEMIDEGFVFDDSVLSSSPPEDISDAPSPGVKDLLRLSTRSLHSSRHLSVLQDFSNFTRIPGDFSSKLEKALTQATDKSPISNNTLPSRPPSIDTLLKPFSQTSPDTHWPVAITSINKDFSVMLAHNQDDRPRELILNTIDKLERLTEELKAGLIYLSEGKNKQLVALDSHEPLYALAQIQRSIGAGEVPVLQVGSADNAESHYQQLYPCDGINETTTPSEPQTLSKKDAPSILRALALAQKAALGASVDQLKKEKLLDVQVSSLLGQTPCWTSDDEEIHAFRMAMERLFNLLPEKLDARFYQIFAASLVPPTLPYPPEPKIHVRVHFPGGLLVRTFECAVDEKVLDVIDRVVASAKHKNGLDAKVMTENLCVQLSGHNTYILHDTKLVALDHVRDCLKRRRMLSIKLDDHSVLKEKGVHEIVHHELDPELVEKMFPAVTSDLTDREDVKANKFIPFSDIHRPLEIRVICVEDADFHNRHLLLTDSEVDAKEGFPLFVTIGLYHGGALIAPLMQSRTTQSINPLWCEWVRTTTQLSEIPRETRVCITLNAHHAATAQALPLGWVSMTLMDFKGQLRTGVFSLNLWPGDANPIGPCTPNYETKNPLKLICELYRFPHAVLFMNEEQSGQKQNDEYWNSVRPRPEDTKTLNAILAKDSLHVLDPEEKKLLWTYRYFCRKNPRALAKVLQSVDWTKNKSVQDAHRMLRCWRPLGPTEALELLDAKFADNFVRAYAVRRLAPLPDQELVDFLPQLTQVIKYEPYHDSALARFLISRALKSRNLIGHAFFWHLQAELQNSSISERYSLLLEAYLRGCGEHRVELLKQMDVTNKLATVAALMKDVPLRARPAALAKELEAISLPTKFITPMNPRLEAASLKIDSSRAMDSLTVPLFLTFNNSDSCADEFVQFIFKAGDDLRQDIVTLQMMGLMDKIWKREGLDLHMSIYGCTATGADMGFIEVVKRSETTATIQKNAGGAKQAFAQTPLANWLKRHNPSQQQYSQAVHNFIHSCAGYCVATYILGLGDRHNDNIMLTKDGNMFHIDFAHWLGNMMEWKGFKRETAPFVFTPQFAHIMGTYIILLFPSFIL